VEIASHFDKKGISPVIAVILIVGITIILASVVSLWVFSFVGETNEKGDNYLFETDMDASDDNLKVSLISGSSVLNTSRMRIIINGLTVTNITVGEYSAGDVIYVDAEFDVLPGEIYIVKLIIDNKMVYDGRPVANP
jgi:flagellin-like protein